MFLKLPNGVKLNFDLITSVSDLYNGIVCVEFVGEKPGIPYDGEDAIFLDRITNCMAERNYYQNFGRTHPVEEA